MHFLFLMSLPLSCISSRALLSPGARRGMLGKAGVEGALWGCACHLHGQVPVQLLSRLVAVLGDCWDSPCCHTCGPIESQLRGPSHQCCSPRNAPVFATPGRAVGCWVSFESSSGSLCSQGLSPAVWAGDAVICPAVLPPLALLPPGLFRALLCTVLGRDSSPSHPLRKLLAVNPH